MLSKICCFFIRLYWKFVPEKNRKICLYRESCSRYIYRTFQEKGFVPGTKAIIYRFQNCKKDYNIIYRNNQILLETKAGNLIDRKDANTEILKVSNRIIKQKL